MFIVKVPLGVSGCEKTSNEILKELKKIFVNEQGKEINFQNLDLEEIHLDNSNLKLTNDLIYKNSFECYETKPKTIFLGGDGAISYSLTRAFLDYYENSGKKPCLIIFDAHADCVLEKGDFPTSHSWLRKVILEGFPTENILLVGARSYSKEEFEFLKENKIQQISINSISEDIDNIADTIMEFASGKEVYVSLDFDVVDPAFAPSVSEPEVGGLSARELIYLIQRINKMKTLRAIDFTGINAEKDEGRKTVKVGAKVLAELI
jgi:arginase family enzyme